MPRTKEEVKQEATWELEAREEYEKKRKEKRNKIFRILIPFLFWFRDNLLGTFAGLCVGLIFGLTSNYFLDIQKQQNERSEIMVEIVARLTNFDQFLGKLDNAPDKATVQMLVKHYRDYVTNPLHSSPFAVSSSLKNDPDFMLSLRYLNANGDKELFEKVNAAYGEIGKVLASYVSIADSFGAVDVRSQELAVRNGALIRQINELRDECMNHSDWPFPKGELSDWITEF